MVVLSSFRALRPPADQAAAVASVPYDVVSESEARALAARDPRSFLHVIRAEVDLEPGADAEARYARAKANLERFQAEGWLRADAAPHIYVYRVGSQTGVAALLATADYRAGRIKRHELTRPAKEDDRTRLLETLQAHVGPVFLTHRDDPAVDAAVATAVAETPLYDFEADDGIRHTVWQARDAAPFIAAFAAFDVYIADGHHRAASAARVDSAMLGVLFPERQVGILAYNRVLSDLNGLTSAAVRERL
ncbi:MAG: DUF1015 domain-containing protein, partial [Planctomycetota bacterium]|nr:DUF1015 domain-containing protein [Planctomycetota bacterium]